jgi:hypothetical protein
VEERLAVVGQMEVESKVAELSIKDSNHIFFFFRLFLVVLEETSGKNLPSF